MLVTKSLPLDSDHFNYDLTEGFEMAVEKDWNVLDFADLNDQLPIYDADLRALNPNKYAVRIFYKACIPMCYIDPENYTTNPLVKDADNASFVGKYLDLVDGTVIGSPINKMSEGSSTEQSYGEYGYHGLLIADDVASTHEAYELPDDRQLNHTNVAKWAFATGSSLATCKISDDDTYLQPYDWATNGFAYMLMNKGGFENGGVASFMVNNGALAYSVDTSANRFNLPTDDHHQSNIKYLQPLLFKPFGVAFEDHLTTHHGTEVATAGWFYCVLGVQEIGGEDPSYQIDPSVTHVWFEDENLDGTSFEPTQGVYTGYSSSVDVLCDTLKVEVADYVELTEATLNGDALTIGSPTDNKYTFSISMIEGTNSLTLKTLDENDQTLTYEFEVEYEAASEVSIFHVTNNDTLDEYSPTPYEPDGTIHSVEFTDTEETGTIVVTTLEGYKLKEVSYTNKTAPYSVNPVINDLGNNQYSFSYDFSDLDDTVGSNLDMYTIDNNEEEYSVRYAYFISFEEDPPEPEKPFTIVRLHDVYDSEGDSDEIVPGVYGQNTYTGSMVHFSTTFSPKADVYISFSDDRPCSNFNLTIDGSAYTPSPSVSVGSASWDRVPVSPQPSVMQVTFDDYDGNHITVTFGGNE